MPDYERKIVYEDAKVQVVLITLPPGAETPIHDHGISIGVIHILSGELSERYYRRQTCDWSMWLHYRAGETFKESAGHIHKVKNFGKVPLDMIGIYYPPLAMKVYPPETFDYPPS